MFRWLRRTATLALLLSGWAVAALCVHVVRVPDPADATRSKWVVVPKNHLGLPDTYVDARRWTVAELPARAAVVGRVIETGHADALRFLVDPRATTPIDEQLRQLSEAAATTRPAVRRTKR